ncbi:MAG: ATP-binding protein, partial [Betaproteobacteria bacterium]
MAIAVSAATGLATLPHYLITRSVRLALQAMSTAIFVATSYLTWHQGGLSSPVAPWLLIVPFALSVAGIQGPATIWFVVVIAEMVLLGALELAGFPLAAHRGNDQRILYAVSHPGLCVLIYAFLFLVNRARRLTLSDLHNKNLELSQARDLAMSAVREKSRFLANMSHEIRTPLNGVIGTADILAGTSLSADQRHFVTMPRQSGDSLLVLINDVLDFSKIEAGKVTLEQTEVDLRELVESVAELFAPRAAEKGLVCTCRLAPQVPSRLVGDPHRLRQILTNLLSNSIKFTASGEVALEVTAARVPGSDDIDIFFRVSDTGIGIDDKARDRLFQAFSQGDETTTRVFGGTGLGLAISSELVRLMGSRLLVESDPGRGSCFWFSLRQRATATFPGFAEAPRSVQPLQPVGILEKHPRSRAVLAELLESMGRRPVVFDSPSVLAASILDNTCPPVCIVDIAQMQDTRWEDLLRRPAPSPPANLPRIFVTAPFAQPDPQCPSVGIAGVISHPI